MIKSNTNNKIIPELNPGTQLEFKSELVKVSPELIQEQFSDIVEFKLTLKNNTELSIPVSKDGYVNVTKLCKAGDNEYSNWKRNKNSESTIQALERSLQIRRDLIIRDIKTGKNESRGTFVHRRLALIIAQWISADFAVQVAAWTEELLLFGKVELGKEKSNEELENKYQEQIKTIQLQLEAKNFELKDKEESLTRMNRVNIELLTFKKNNQKNESIYIVATLRYARNGIFKVGRTKCMKARTSGHNNTHIAGDKVKVLKEFKVNDCVAVENYIHRKLKGLLVLNEKEFFICPYDLLENIIENIINNDNSHNNLIDSIIDIVYQLKCSNYSSDRWTRGIDTTIFNEEYQLILPGDKNEVKAVFDITCASSEQKKEFVSKCVQAYKVTIEEPNKIIWKTFQIYLISQLKIPRKKYKALEWRPIFNETRVLKPTVEPPIKTLLINIPSNILP